MGFFSSPPQINWEDKPTHLSLKDAIESSDTPPYKVRTRIERCSAVAGLNYGQFTMIPVDEDYILVTDFTGGIEGWVGLMQAGDEVVMLVKPYENKYHFGSKPEPYSFFIKDLVNVTLEKRFGELRLRCSEDKYSTRQWLTAGGQC